MFGDVFGNRDLEVYTQDLGRDSGSRTPTDTHTPTHVHRWQPVFEQERITARYGYDPWTKSAFNLSTTRTRWWCWQWDNPVWHAALHYTVGSLLFVIASFAALFITVRETPSLKRWLYAYPYMMGSINYTTGATILLYQSIKNHPSKMVDPEESVPPSYSGFFPAQPDGAGGFARNASPYQDREGNTNPPSVYESTYETSTFENVSRPPSFHSIKWWQAEPDRENSAASMSTSVQPATIAEQSSTLTSPHEPNPCSSSHMEAEESQVPLLGMGDVHEPLLPQTDLAQKPTQPHLTRIKTTPRSTPRVSSRSLASTQDTTDAAAAVGENIARVSASGSLAAFGSVALPASQVPCDTSPSTAQHQANLEAQGQHSDTHKHSSGAASHSPSPHCRERSIGAAALMHASQAPSPGDARASDSNTRSQPKASPAPGSRARGGMVGASSHAHANDAVRPSPPAMHTLSCAAEGSTALSDEPATDRDESPRSHAQYPATPRTPKSTRGGPGDDQQDDQNDRETGIEDDRSTMISQPTDTQSMKSYYRLFSNRWTAVSTAEQQADAENILTVQSRHPDQLNSLLRNYYRRDAFYYIRADPWYNRRWLLDVSGSASIFAGAMLYNVSCTCLLYEAIVGELPQIFSSETVNEDLLAYYPATIGGLCFIIGSWLFWWAAHKTPLLWGIWIRLYTMEWWVTFLNLIGSLGFFYGAVTAVPVGEIQGLVPNWFELVIGYVIGSVLFMVGSYLMVAELASHAASSAALTL